MIRTLLAAARGPLAIAIVLAAIAWPATLAARGSSPATSADPVAGKVPSAPPLGRVDRPLGATVVVLRITTMGGVGADLADLLAVPTFSLYGDGSVIVTCCPAGDEDEPVARLLSTRLDADRIDRLLEEAIDALGPRLDRTEARGTSGADALVTIFSIVAGGRRGAVYATSLGSDPADADLVALARSLTDPEAGVLAGSDLVPYEPKAYLASFVEEDPASPGVVAWPWTDDVPSAALLPAVDDGLVPTVTLEPSQVARVADLPVGPRADVVLGTPDGRALRMFLRPLLPDELPPTDAGARYP